MQKVMGAESGVPGANVRFAPGFQDLFSVSRTEALEFLAYSDRVHNRQNPSLSGLPGLVAQGYRPPTIL